MLPGMLMPPKQNTPQSEAPDLMQQRAMPRQVQMPGPDFRPGVSGEFDYGLSAPYTTEYMQKYSPQRMAMGGMVDNPYAERYAQERGEMLAPVAAQMGAPMRMAEGGGIERMVPGYGPVAMQAGGIAEIGAEPMPGGAQPNEREVISAAVAAIQGQHPQPEVALGMFLQQYGEEALRDLVDRVQSGELGDTAARSEGQLNGPGDGMNDMIPASIDGQQDVLLSDGEYVVPADVVSHLGNGSTDAGARELDKMAERARKARTGTGKQAPAVPQERMLPV
jgi:hypothetical protein